MRKSVLQCSGSFRLLFSLLFLGACQVWAAELQDSKHKEPLNQQSQSKNPQSEVQRIKLSPKTKNQVLDVLRANEALHSYFFKYESKKIDSAKEDLKSALLKVSDVALSQEIKDTLKHLDKINETNSKDENNRYYSLVSNDLIHLVKKYDVGNQYNAFSCPMVKMTWLQNTKKSPQIQNPYASQMPTCGTQETKY